MCTKLQLATGSVAQLSRLSTQLERPKHFEHLHTASVANAAWYAGMRGPAVLMTGHIAARPARVLTRAVSATVSPATQQEHETVRTGSVCSRTCTDDFDFAPHATSNYSTVIVWNGIGEPRCAIIASLSLRLDLAVWDLRPVSLCCPKRRLPPSIPLCVCSCCLLSPQMPAPCKLLARKPRLSVSTTARCPPCTRQSGWTQLC